MDTTKFLDRITALFKEALDDNLVGIYLHGSLAMGCFNSQKSDIDFLVIVKHKLTQANCTNIAKISLSLHDEMVNGRGIECTIVLEKYLLNFVYPTPFEFHYSEYHREAYLTNNRYLCGGFEDKDLASQIVVAYERGKTLFGEPLKNLYDPIDRHYYLASILCDVEGMADEVDKAYLTPVYITLNLCRVLYFVEEDMVSSKREGGEWGLRRLPPVYRELLSQCLQEYNGEISYSKVDKRDLQHFIEFMLKHIKLKVEVK